MKKNNIWIVRMLSILTILLTAIYPTSNILADGSNHSTEEKVVKVGYVNEAGYQEGRYSDYKTGSGYEYLQRISYLTGWKYEYEYGTFPQLFDKLKKGEIDIMNGISYSENRSEDVNFSSYSSGKNSYYLYCLSENQELCSGNMNSLAGKKIGVTKNSIQEGMLKEWLANNNIEVEIVGYFSNLGLCNAMDSGEIDAGVLVDHTERLGYSAIVNIGSSEFYFGVSKERKDLLDELNKALCTIQSDEPLFNDSVVNKYVHKKYYNKNLSSEEKEWLNFNKEITVGYVRDYLPFCGTDDNGKPIGGMVDIVSEIISSLGFEDKLKVKYKEYATHDQLIEALQEGNADVVFPMLSDFYYSEQSNIMESYEIVSSTIGLVYEGEYSSKKLKTIAISSHSPMQKICSKIFYPNCEIVELNSAEECLDAVKNKTVDGTLFNMSRAQTYLELKRYSKLHVAASGHNVSYCFAVKKGNAELLSILNKAISSLDQTFMSEKMNDYVKYNHSYTLLDFIQEHVLGVLLLVASIIILISIIVALFIVQRNVNKSAMTDQLTGCKNRMAMNWAYEGHFDKGISVGLIMCDLNGLKKRNDEKGHEEGDRYICLASEILRDCFGNDNVYRIGGDEFVVILKGEKEETIHRKIKDFKSKCRDYDVSMSNGFAYRDIYEDEFEAMMKEADNKMYSAKKEFYRSKCDKK